MLTMAIDQRRDKNTFYSLAVNIVVQDGAASRRLPVALTEVNNASDSHIANPRSDKGRKEYNIRKYQINGIQKGDPTTSTTNITILTNSSLPVLQQSRRVKEILQRSDSHRFVGYRKLDQCVQRHNATLQ